MQATSFYLIFNSYIREYPRMLQIIILLNSSNTRQRKFTYKYTTPGFHQHLVFKYWGGVVLFFYKSTNKQYFVEVPQASNLKCQ